MNHMKLPVLKVKNSRTAIISNGFPNFEACVCAKSLQSCLTLRPYGLQPTRLFCRPWDSPGKNTGVGCHALLQRIFPTRGSNLGLLCYRQILYQLSHHPATLLNLFINSSKFCVEFLECSLHGMSFAYNDRFTFSLSTILNRNGGSGRPCALDFRRQAFTFSPSSIMLAVGLS